MSEARIHHLVCQAVVTSSVLHSLIATHPNPRVLLAVFLEQRRLAEDLIVNSLAAEASIEDVRAQFENYERMIREIQPD